VTLVPARKKTISRTKGRLHGCTACAAAVKPAVIIPKGVSVLRDQARYSIAKVIGTAIIAFIVKFGDPVSRGCGVVVLKTVG
jgi:hypothetical protein